MGKRAHAESLHHPGHHADEHLKPFDETYGHTQGGTTTWTEVPSSHLPPPDSLPVLHAFANRIARASRILLPFVGPGGAGNWVRTILRVPTGDATPGRPDVLYFESKLALDTDGATGLAHHDKSHQHDTSYRERSGASIDANKVPYIVLPKYPGDFWWALGVRPFDIAAVIFRQRVVYAIFADQGPPNQLGEASIEVHRLLGLERVVHGDVVDRSFSTGHGKKEHEEFVQTIVFPRSGERNGTDVATIERHGRDLFVEVGGAPPDGDRAHR